jgi:hypothetical protein
MCTDNPYDKQSSTLQNAEGTVMHACNNDIDKGIHY